MAKDSEKRRNRYDTIGEVRFSRNRVLVVSVLGDRVVLGQRIEFEDDAGGQGQAFLKNAPSLDREHVKRLVELLGTAYDRLNAPDGQGG